MKRKKKKPVRKAGEHWFELQQYFDPDGIQALPMKQGRSFILGTIKGMVIVEISKDTEPKTIRQLGDYLAGHGLEALIVSEGVRFLKLRQLSLAEELQLDEAARNKPKSKEQPDGEQRDDTPPAESKLADAEGA